MTLLRARHTCQARFTTWSVEVWFLFLSVAHVFGVHRWFFLSLTQRTSAVWSFLLLWSPVPPSTKTTRKLLPLEWWERDPFYPEQNPYSWSRPSPAPGPSDMPSTHTHTHTDLLHWHTMGSSIKYTISGCWKYLLFCIQYIYIYVCIDMIFLFFPEKNSDVLLLWRVLLQLHGQYRK